MKFFPISWLGVALFSSFFEVFFLIGNYFVIFAACSVDCVSSFKRNMPVWDTGQATCMNMRSYYVRYMFAGYKGRVLKMFL